LLSTNPFELVSLEVSDNVRDRNFPSNRIGSAADRDFDHAVLFEQ